jgi:hypothetical protein
LNRSTSSANGAGIEKSIQHPLRTAGFSLFSSIKKLAIAFTTMLRIQLRNCNPSQLTGRPGLLDWSHLPKRILPEKEGDGAMKDLIVQIAKALVDNPEQVAVNVLEGSQATVLELAVAKEDLGKIIGKQGRTARAIRTILSAASAKQRKRAVLEIVE